MRALIQRVSRARCTVDGRVTGAIERGLVVLLGAAVDDRPVDADWTARKVAGLRVFEDDGGQMNRDVLDVGGGCLVIPQFTLYGETRRGRRPDFLRAARPEVAEPLVERFCVALAAASVPVQRGVFRAHMEIELVNDGPVTLMVESPRAGAAMDPRPTGEGRPGGSPRVEPEIEG